MNRDDITCVLQAIKASKKEENRLAVLHRKARIEAYTKEEAPTIIKKEDLKNHEWMIVEIRNNTQFIGIDDDFPSSTKIACIDVKVNDEKGELSAVRTMYTRGKGFWFEQYTFFMEKYGKTWRAWTGPTAKSPVWDS